MENISYSYSIKSVNLDTGEIHVEYVPNNISLKPTSITVWVELNELSEFDLVQAIKDQVPLHKWNTTLYLLDNYNTIVNTSGTVVANE